MMPVRNLKLTVDSHVQNASEREKLAHLHSLIVREVSALDIGERVKITLECDTPADGSNDPHLEGGSDTSAVKHITPMTQSKSEMKLSERQHQIAVMLCNHYSIKRIASEFYVSENTVKKHVQNIKKALEIECSGADFIYTLKQFLTPKTN